MDGLVIEKHPVPLLSVFAKGFTVVRGYRDDGVLIQPVLPQHFHEAANNRIGICDLAVVRGGGIVSFERFWRVIRVVSIVEMQPDEKRPLLVTAQPTQGSIGNILRAPLHALVAVFARLTLVK